MRSEKEIRDTLNYTIKQLGKGDINDLVLSGIIAALSYVLEQPPFSKNIATTVRENLVNYIEYRKG